MNKHLISAGHYQVIPTYLDKYVNKDNPYCKGKEHIRYCYFSGVECKEKCFEPVSNNCSKFHQLRKFHSIEDKFGVVRR